MRGIAQAVELSEAIEAAFPVTTVQTRIVHPIAEATKLDQPYPASRRSGVAIAKLSPVRVSRAEMVDSEESANSTAPYEPGSREFEFLRARQLSERTTGGLILRITAWRFVRMATPRIYRIENEIRAAIADRNWARFDVPFLFFRDVDQCMALTALGFSLVGWRKTN